MLQSDYEVSRRIYFFIAVAEKAHIEIDLQAYEVTENTQLLLLPGSIFNCNLRQP